MFKCDYHTHTRYSFDGGPESTVDALCRSAIENGVTDLAITDHFECNWRTESTYPPFDADAVLREVMEARERYRGKLSIAFGAEIGQANQFPEEAKALLEAHSYDFIIGSIHNLTGTLDFYYFDFAKIKRNRQRDNYIAFLFERHLEEMCAALDALPKVDTLGHLTYMQRYCALAGLDYDFTKHSASAEKLFRKMIAREIALEVNVSTLWKGLGFAMPDKEFLTLYRDLGGRLVTVGTDSHYPSTVGSCVEDGFALLKSVGLNDVVVIRDGKKTIVKI